MRERWIKIVSEEYRIEVAESIVSLANEKVIGDGTDGASRIFLVLAHQIRINQISSSAFIETSSKNKLN